MTGEPVRILMGDVIDGLKRLGDGSVHCCVTSPPYWGLRDYGVDGQIGLEPTPEAFIEKMVAVFREVRRVLREDGTLWLNIGDSYASKPPGCGSDGVSRSSTLHGVNGVSDAYRETLRNSVGQKRNTIVGGLKPKDLCMMPWRVALALQADGWWIRSVIVWAKKSPMPESCRDRPTSSWEPIFLMAKSDRYFYDGEAVKEYGAGREVFGNWIDGQPCPDRNDNNRQNMTPTLTRNQRNVWHLGPEPYSEAHFATFPTEIPRRAIKAGTSEKGCCPMCGAGWRRAIERSTVNTRPGNTAKYRDDALGYKGHETKAGLLYRPETSTRTTGWEPGCECGAGEPVPCVVLDPFLGSGTTVAVARELGRWGVGCELNPEYAELARRRIGKAERPETFRDDRVLGEAPLFDALASGAAEVTQTQTRRPADEQAHEQADRQVDEEVCA